MPKSVAKAEVFTEIVSEQHASNLALHSKSIDKNSATQTNSTYTEMTKATSTKKQKAKSTDPKAGPESAATSCQSSGARASSANPGTTVAILKEITSIQQQALVEDQRPGAVTSLMQKIQNTILKAITPLAELSDSLSNLKSKNDVFDTAKAVRQILDSVALLTHANCDIIQRRRKLIRPDLNKPYQQICAEHVSFTGFLSGDDLPQKIKDINMTNRLMEKDCFMASVDLRDAYYSVPMSVHAQKYLKFTWSGKLYQFTCLPNGLCCAPRLFTKLLKPVYSTLRLKGHLSVGYIDDSYLQGNTFVSCQENVTDTVNIFQDLGFTIHPEKSILVPTRKLTFLGFILDSQFMRISLTAGKADSLKAAAHALLLRKSPTIREAAEVIGKMVASFPGVQLGPLYYRQLENDKIKALREKYGNFDRPMVISGTARADLKGWINNIHTSYKPIRVAPPVMELKSDASHLDWGAVHGDRSTGGRWTDNEKLQHNNVLELQAAFFAMKVFCKEITNAHVKVFSDNTTTVTYINNMGGSHSLHCNALTRDMWLWCIDKGIWLSAAHLPGSQNIQADRASRIFHDQTEGKLDQDIFHRITSQLIKPEVDPFASRLNFQLDRYVSWKPDPGALAVDAFTLDWSSPI
ncbi:uncharacterized protein [Montipora foliosa]|uniref:uncharacterized protein n=1 Tax=Montipora foliosa TaxID=591990 RepID=UPI0035F1E702